MRAVACAVALAVLLGGCVVSYRRGIIGDDIPGRDVARTIDTQIAPILRTVPDLVVGHAACSEHLDVSNGKTAYCTLPAGGATLRVAVTSGKGYGTFFVRQADTLLDMQRLERTEPVFLANEYGLHADVHCGPPRFRAAPPGARVTCRLSGRHLPTDRIDFKVMNVEGRVVALRPRGARSPGMDALLPYIRLHKLGRPTIVPGKLLARQIHTLIEADARRDPQRRTPIGAATCPDKVDLSGTRRGVCRQRVFGKDLRYETWIDGPAGLHVHGVEFALETNRVAAVAVDTYRKKLEAAGMSQMVAVDCGPDRVVVATAEHGIPCKVTYGARKRPMTAYPDAAGRGLRFYVPSL